MNRDSVFFAHGGSHGQSGVPETFDRESQAEELQLRIPAIPDLQEQSSSQVETGSQDMIFQDNILAFGLGEATFLVLLFFPIALYFIRHQLHKRTL